MAEWKKVGDKKLEVIKKSIFVCFQCDRHCDRYGRYFNNYSQCDMYKYIQNACERSEDWVTSLHGAREGFI